MNVAVKVENVKHLCELQIHLMPIKDSEALHRSHTVYEYFRSFFLGNSDAVEKRLEMLCKAARRSSGGRRRAGGPRAPRL